jgi:hypothetical protein
MLQMYQDETSLLDGIARPHLSDYKLGILPKNQLTKNPVSNDEQEVEPTDVVSQIVYNGVVHLRSSYLIYPVYLALEEIGEALLEGGYSFDGMKPDFPTSLIALGHYANIYDVVELDDVPEV